MSNLFLHIYDYFSGRRGVFYTVLVVVTGVLLFFALRMGYDGQVTGFFPDDDQGAKYSQVFANLRIKDKIVVMFSAAETAGTASGAAGYPAYSADATPVNGGTDTRASDSPAANSDVHPAANSDVHPAASDPASPFFSTSDPDRLIEAGDAFLEEFLSRVDSSLVHSVISGADESGLSTAVSYVYDNLPLFLSEEDYQKLDTLTTREGIGRRMDAVYDLLVSPAGIGIGDILLRDPLGIGTEVFAHLRDFAPDAGYEVYGGHVFTDGPGTMLIVVNPAHGTVSAQANEKLIDALEESIGVVAEKFTDVDAEYFGGPSVAVYNARQIRRDTALTLTIALVIIIAFILMVFRNRWAVLLILTPVVFGGIFSLAVMWLIGEGTVSAIAVGAGAVVFGIALSYSIHVLAHSNHTPDPREVIKELASPLTVGGFTTIGAFLGLIFTKSELLRDFGLFSALTLTGTTLFCLVFMPHFLGSPDRRLPSGRLLRALEKINGYRFDRNRWLVGGVLLAAAACLFFYGRVRFDSDMMHLNYTPPHIQKAQEKLEGLSEQGKSSVILVAADEDPDAAYGAYVQMNRRLDDLRDRGSINGFSSAERFLPSAGLRKERIRRWNDYWDGGKRESVMRNIESEAAAHGFRQDAFGAFGAILNANHTGGGIASSSDQPSDQPSFQPSADRSIPTSRSASTADSSDNSDSTDNSNGTAAPAPTPAPAPATPAASAGQPVPIPAFLEDWTSCSGGITMYITRMEIDTGRKEEVYRELEDLPRVMIVDRAHFANSMAKTVSDDFNLVLFISSMLIFGALLISYGRIELAALAFLPMFLSWIIILGLMAILGIEFNIVNIILSTFIFGLGDDFSIFIMDGLLGEYRDGRKLLPAHKTAIFFSAFTVVVGIGVLLLAEHPALRSISMISILGIVTVVLVAFTVQPVIFRLFISSQTAKGGFPYTLLSLLNTVYEFTFFVAGCIGLQAVMAVMLLLPVNSAKKKEWFHDLVYRFCRVVLRLSVTAKRVEINEENQDFRKPAVIIANHSSFIDILVMLGLHPKVVMVTKNWVWRSPVFGRIVRYGGFYNVDEGYGNLAESLRPALERGYSVVVFPEGTRSADGRIHRFHKGAFLLAEKLKLDIIPVVLYGNNMVSSKTQGLYIKKGLLVSKILPAIHYGDARWGTGYKERAKAVCAYFKDEYHKVYEKFNRPSNPWFYDALIKNYTYKSPVLEWYMRIKVGMEHSYRFFDEVLPREGFIVDIGCGYGPLSYMLSMLSEGREVLGIDYDKDKIGLANHSFSRNERIGFVCADAINYDLPFADAFVLNDVLHYMDPQSQETLLEHCFEKLNAGGKIIVRDGDPSREQSHRVTRRTEKWSTRIVKFNKTNGGLCFPSSRYINEIASRHGFSVEAVRNDKRTSNTIYVITKDGR